MNPSASVTSPRQGSAAVGVSVEGLSKDFSGFPVLRGISLTVNPGEIFVLMGPSGSGKSVLLKHVVGLERPSAGRVLVDGHDAADPATRGRVRMALVAPLAECIEAAQRIAAFIRSQQS